MRFASLELLAFGHFSGESLNFANRDSAIDIVYGDNEAGKSTSLRAVSGFLYGIPVRTSDDFVHQKPTLRIGAVIVSQDGERLQLVRRKGAKDTLRDSGDNAVGDGVLAGMLGGLNRELFEQMFALSRDALVSGGNDLLTGSGSLGEALFGASLGLSGINDILHTLEDEAAELFKPGGSVPKLNASLRELDDFRRQVRELELRPADYLAHQSALDNARLQREALDADLRMVQGEFTLLERNKQLLPLQVTRGQVLAETEALGNVVILADTAREERLAALRDLERANADAHLAQQRVDTLSAQFELLKPNEALLAHAGEIRKLHQEIGAHQKAARDLPSLRGQRRTALTESEALLAQTHQGRTLEDAAGLRPTVAVRTAIASLGEDFVRIEEATRAAEEKVVITRARLKLARETEAALPTLVDVSSVRAVLTSAQRLGDIEAAIAEGDAKHRAAKAQLGADLSVLPLFNGSIGDLEHLAVPAFATLKRFEAEHKQLADQQHELESARTRVESGAARHRERLRALDLVGVVPSEAELATARSHRNRGWSIVRRALEGPETTDEVLFDDQRPLADAYEVSVSAADDVADRLRREAERVAQRAELEASIETCEIELGELGSQLADVDEARAQHAEQWTNAWAASRIAPLPPAEMSEWSQAREALVTEAAAQREERGRLDGKMASLNDHREALIRELAALGRNVAATLTLSALFALAQDAIEEHGRAAAAGTKARESVAQLEYEEQADSDAADRATMERSTWATAWANQVVELGLSPDMKPNQVRTVVETLDELFAKLDTAATFKGRTEAIDRDAREFAEAATRVAEAIEPDLRQLTPDQTVTELHRLLDAAQAEAAQASELRKQLDELSEALQQAFDRGQAAGAELKRLMKVAKCKSVEALESAEERSASALELRARLKTVEEQMTQIGAAPAASLAAEVAGLELVELESGIDERRQLLEELNEQRRDIDETVGQERALLKEMSGGEGAADAAAAVEASKASVREQAEHYARLRIAIAILRGQIDRFREESHGPLLSRASYFFAKLTCKRYTGLTTGFDERGNVVLLGRRQSGAEITVEEMSEGTRDQLYLALRLATIEQQLERSEPLPLIVDDLFVNFDDRRAAAGFEALAEIAQKTQVIFFTHHRHLVELAGKTLKPEQWAVHELHAGTSAIEAAA